MWSSEHSIDSLYSPGYGTVHGSHNDLRTGGHAPGGFLVASNSIAETMDFDNADCKDIAPTVLQLLDVPIPETMEGRGLLTATAPSTLSP